MAQVCNSALSAGIDIDAAHLTVPEICEKVDCARRSRADKIWDTSRDFYEMYKAYIELDT